MTATRHLSYASLPVPHPDPIFAILEEARRAGPAAINATIGVMMDEEGRTVLFPSVTKAIEEIGADIDGWELSYPSLLGLEDFRFCVARLLFGSEQTMFASIASTAGTGAVALNLRLLKKMDDAVTVILPTPAWANHPPLCAAANIRVRAVQYLSGSGLPTMEPIALAVGEEKGPTAALLQVGCHNPTGLDFTLDQWEDIADLLQKHHCMPLLDCSYQGFVGEPEQDREVLEIFRRKQMHFLVAWSAAKNHSIYGLRVGLAGAVVPDDTIKATVEGHYSALTRGIHSAAATIGQSIVSRVQQKYGQEWRDDLRQARSTLERKRTLLMEALPKKFHSCLSGHGMFAMLPLSVEEITQLKRELVFMTNDGRINIAAIPDRRIEEFAEKIETVSRL